MNKITVITGGGTGIGKALAIHLAREKNLKVLIAGRRLNKLEETKAAQPENIRVAVANVSTAEGRQEIYDAIPENHFIQCLVHNAAVLGPVKQLMDFTRQEWRQHQATNVEGPLFLTQKLLPKLSGGRVLHISSGAAHHGYAGWGAYCTSKAALFAVYEVLREELQEKNILVGSVQPGVVDTPMQDEVRTAAENVFPMLQKFIKLRNDRQLVAPDQIALFLTYVLLETSKKKYCEAEWNYRDFVTNNNKT